MPTRSAPAYATAEPIARRAVSPVLHRAFIGAPMTPSTSSVAVLGGGCFWCLDAVFRGLTGVISVESGYAGGQDPHPTYEAVCTGGTGHAEVVKITFDPNVLTFRDLLTVFFT